MDYKNSVFLPKTNFTMKANLPKREPEILNGWITQDLYQKIRQKSKNNKKFTLHFGPPYANGHIHIGHALSEILKDVINKSYQMKGFNAAMIPGWDCHGLPIEWKIEEHYRAQGLNKDDVNPTQFRNECRAFAQKWTDIQKNEFKRLGLIADFDNAYSTMNFKTEARIIAELGHFLMDGSLYKGLKPVMWSVVEKTALAEAEVEYKEHISDSIMVAFKIVQSHHAFLKDVFAVIWTTTPWTLPGNRAIAYGPDIAYVVIEITQDTTHIKAGQKFLVAKDRLHAFLETLEISQTKTLFKMQGVDLQNTLCHHPFYEKGYTFDVPMIPGDHVTTEAGTGLVHTAPDHGLEDFEVSQRFDIPVPLTVQGDGTYYDHIPLFAGKHIFKVNPLMLQELQEAGALLHATKLSHSYPHSWRSKAPLIYRTTAQWFISMEATRLREKALTQIENVEWIPAQGKNRIKSMVESRPDWCVSRQRAWGTPITVFIHKKTGEVLRDAQVHQTIVDSVAKEGIDAWYNTDAQFFLGERYPANLYEKVTDVLDVWFDSGCSHIFTLSDNPDQDWPADVYLEGSDQHRGWFQSSLLHSCGTRAKAPYKKVVTHGFVLDERGYKMSKSQGNTVSPEDIIKEYGADLLRLWVINSDYTEDLRIGKEILKRQEDIYRRFRNTIRYLLGALADFKAEEEINYQDLPELEQFILHRLYELHQDHQKAMETFNFSNFYMSLHTFCSIDLSAFYFDIRKDVLYCDAETSLKRKATRTVMTIILNHIIHWLAPVLSYTAEEAYMEYQTQMGKTEPSSIHLSCFPSKQEQWSQPALEKKWHDIRMVRSVVTAALEIERAAKTIGSSLQAEVDLYLSPPYFDLCKTLDLAELFITSKAILYDAPPPPHAFCMEELTAVHVVVKNAQGHKCQRCWKVLCEVNPEDITRQHAAVCNRCEDVVLNAA